MKRIERVGVFWHPQKFEAVEMAGRVKNWLRGYNIDVDAGVSSMDAAITLGGDGFILDVANTFAKLGLAVPMARINYGTIGALANIEPPEVQRRLEDLLEGNYVTQDRTRLGVNIEKGSKVWLTATSLNDVVVERRFARAIRFAFSINGSVFHQWADGVLIATRTGSTGLNRSLGGAPILKEFQAVLRIMGPTNIENCQINHTVAASSEFRIFNVDQEMARLVVDGGEQTILSSQDTVIVKKAGLPTKFIEFGD